MFGLALAYLRDRWMTTALNVVLLGIAVATLVLLLLFSSQLENRFERDARGIDLVVGAKGSPLQLILSSIYQVDMPTGNIPLSSVDLLRRDPGVARVVPVALGDNFRGFRIVGTEPSYLGIYDAELGQGRMNKAVGEVLLGATVARETGAKLGQKFLGSHGLGEGEGESEHGAHPFTTVGILKPTGTVADRLILTSIESVWDVHGIEHDEEGMHAEAEHEAHGAGETHHDEPVLDARGELQPEVTALLVSYRNASGAIRIPGMINRQTEMQSAVPAIETARLLTLFGSAIEGARIFAWLLALTGGLSIFVALLNQARAREGDLALLRVMGATRSTVFGTILLEGLVTAAAGVVLGLVLGHALMWIAGRSFQTLADIGLSAFNFHPGEVAIAAAVLGIGIVAALLPAARVFRVDLARTLARAS
ncbi:MAG: ABC transporter permease [Pseudomonadota bacterium]|nr:ABC transporter permease [Pseudomonadota bacterium]